ncbi:MAG: hypothetical protein HC915_05105 [Anaerolineae bacterium]|nr:hypothetical protein [Anaerolineae bacterium]
MCSGTGVAELAAGHPLYDDRNPVDLPEVYPPPTRGWWGGFPQTSLFSARGPRTNLESLENLWLVGDSVFPGQSTAGVTAGGMRVAADVVRTAGRRQTSVLASSTPSRTYDQQMAAD